MGTLIQTFPDGGSGGASARMITDEFSTSVDYAVGDLVIYDKTLYKFTSAHSAGAWDPSDVTDDVTVDSELKLKQNLSDTFNGTLQQWEALPLATKLTYKYANITNDPTEQLEIVSADIDIENHVVHLDGDELVGLNGIWKTQGEYGVKNLIPYPYVTNSKTQNDVTFTINSDGSVSLSGTATADASLILMSIEDNTYSGYKMSGGYSNTIYMRQRITDKSGTFIRSTQDYGNGAVLDSINQSTEKYTIMIWVANGAVTDGITIYPMLRSANDTDKTYRPYAKTNKQLTDEISGNASDIDEIDERLDNTTTAVTGNPISITGLKSNQLAINPFITLEPIQAGSGDPSPSNVRAISGYDKIEVLSAGQNLFDKTATRDETNATASINGDIITVTGRFSCNFDLSLPAGIYTCLCSDILETSGSDPTPRVSFGYTDGTFSDSFMYGTINTNGKTVKCLAIYATSSPNHTATVVYKNIAIIAGSNYNNVKLTLGQTIYGGTLDVEKGILTVDRKCIDLGSLNFGYDPTNVQYYSGEFLNDAKISSTGLYTNGMICSTYVVDSRTYPELSNVHIRGVYVDNRLYIAADSDSYSFNGVQLVYELATPYTIQLTPHEISLLKDYAYVSTNGTNIQFFYKNGEMASLGDVAQLGQTVNELSENVKREYVSVDITTSMTYGQGLAALYSKIDMNKVTVYSKLIIINEILYPRYVTSEHISFIGATMNSVETAHMTQADISSTTKQLAEYIYSSGTINDISNLAAWTNGKIILYY